MHLVVIQYDSGSPAAEDEIRGQFTCFRPAAVNTARPDIARAGPGTARRVSNGTRGQR